jgi:hypothetical protein
MKEKNYDFKLGQWSILLFYSAFMVFFLQVLGLIIDEILLNYIALIFVFILLLIIFPITIMYFNKSVKYDSVRYSKLLTLIEYLRLKIKLLEKSKATIEEEAKVNYNAFIDEQKSNDSNKQTITELNQSIFNLKEHVSKIRNQKDRKKLETLIDDIISKENLKDE